MPTLYKLTEEFKQLLDMLDDPDYADYGEAVRETLSCKIGELEHKAEGYAMVIKQLEYDASAKKAEGKRLTESGQSTENKAKMMKKTLEETMIVMGKTKFKTPLFSFNIQKNTPSVEIESVQKLPEKYLVFPEPVPDKEKIKKDLKDGIAIIGCSIKQTESLRIR